MDKQTILLLDKYQNEKKVFKSCDTYIVVLEKLKDTITNEMRKDIFDIKRAQYRGNKFKVIDIISKVGIKNKKEKENQINNIQEISSDYDSKFVYRKNEIVKCNDYDTNIVQECSSGIHYYLSWNSAYYHRLDKILLEKDTQYTGKDYLWYYNGKILTETNYVNGKLQGEEKSWHINGKIKTS